MQRRSNTSSLDLQKKYCTCQAGLRRKGAAQSPSLNWYEIMQHIVFEFNTQEYANPFVYVKLDQDGRLLTIHITYFGTIFEIVVTLPGVIVLNPEVTVEEDSGFISLTFRKVVSRIWNSHGSMHNKILKENKCITYEISRKIKVYKNEYLLCLKARESIYFHIPPGMSCKLTCTRADDSRISQYYSPLPFSRSINPYFELVYEMMKDYNTTPLVFLVKLKDDPMHISKYFEVGNQVIMSDPIKTVDLSTLAAHTRLLLLGVGIEIAAVLGVVRYLVYRQTVKVRYIHFMWYISEKNNAFCIEMLNQLSASDPRMKYSIIVEKPTPDWTGPTGLLEIADLMQFFPPATDEPITYAFCYGPLDFTEKCVENLTELGLSEIDIHTIDMSVLDD